MQVYKLAQKEAYLQDFHVKTVGSAVNSIFLECFTRVRGRGLRATALGEAGIVLSKIPDAVLVDGSAFNPGSSGDDYGLVLANCQNVTTFGGQYHARRHGVATGGYTGAGCVPCRNCVTVEASISNDPASGVHAAGMHGNAEDCWYINSHIRGGTTFQGKNNGIRGGSLTSMANGVLVYSAELLGGDFTLDGVSTVITVSPQLVGRGVIDIGGQNNALTAGTVEPATFTITNNKFKSTALSSLTSFTYFRNAGTTQPVDVKIEGNAFQVNALGAILRSALDAGTATSRGVSIINNSGNLPAGINLHAVSSGTYASFPHRLPTFSGIQTITTSTGASSVSGTTVVLKYTYPRQPHIVPSVSNVTYIGTVAVIPGGIRHRQPGLRYAIHKPHLLRSGFYVYRGISNEQFHGSKASKSSTLEACGRRSSAWRSHA